MEDRALPFIHPDDPKPVSLDAQQARRRAIREGRVIAPPRDEFERDEAAKEAAKAEAEAAEAAAKAEAEARRKQAEREATARLLEEPTLTAPQEPPAPPAE